MEVTEQQRHQLFVWFEEQMGPERAATMMELIPPAGASEPATRAEMSARFDAVDARLDTLDASIDARTERLRSDLLRTFGTRLLASQAAVIAAVGVLA
jgi:hypothetical protein